MKPEGRFVWLSRLSGKDRVDAAIGTVVGLYCIVVAVGDLAGIWTNLNDKIPSLTLLLLAVVSLYLVFERHSSIRDIRESLDKVDGRVAASSSEMAQINGKLRHIDSFFGAASLQDRFSQLRLLYASRELAKLGTDTTITLGREYIFPAWLDCLNIAQSFEAFNYVRSDEVWRSGWFEDVSHASQVGRVLDGATIKRIFMVDTLAERDHLEPLMLKQASAGIDVRWVLASEIRALPFMHENFEILGTEDIIAINGELVFRVFLDRDRSMQSCSITRDVRLVGIVKQVVAAGYRISRPISGLEGNS